MTPVPAMTTPDPGFVYVDEYGIEYAYAIAIFEGDKLYEGRGHSCVDGQLSRLVRDVLPLLQCGALPFIRVLIEQTVPGVHPPARRVVGWYYARVLGFHHYPHCRAMLESEGVSAMLPGVSDLTAGIRVYNQWSDPDREFWALRIQPTSACIHWDEPRP